MKKFFKEYYDVFLREFRLVKSDMGVLIFFLLLPIAYPIAYSLIYNPELVRDVPVVVVDHDRSASSRQLVRELDATEGIRTIGYAPDLSEGRKAVNEHKVYAILEIPEGFEKRIGRGEQAPAVIYCEMSLLLRYRAILVGATDVMQNMGAQITTERIDRIAPLAETIATGDLMPVNDIEMGNLESGFDSFIMPGILILILQQSMILAIGMLGGANREHPFRGWFVPGSGRPSIITSMLARTAVYMCIMIVPAIYIIHYVPLMFSFPMAGSTLQEFMFIIPLMLSTIFFGFVIQGAVKERESIFVIWVVTSVIFLFLSGLTWPRYAMTGFWKFLSDCIPATWGVEGFIKMNTNGASLSQVSESYTALWILTAVYAVIGYVIQRYVQYPAICSAANKEISTEADSTKENIAVS